MNEDDCVCVFAAWRDDMGLDGCGHGIRFGGRHFVDTCVMNVCYFGADIFWVIVKVVRYGRMIV